MSDKKKDGGPAFPVLANWDNEGNFISGAQTGTKQGYADGMTLRDYFAGQAIPGLAARRWEDDNGKVPIDIMDTWAKSSYALADAMLRAREQ